MAQVLKSRINDSNVPASQKGYLRIPESHPPDKSWVKVGVQIIQNKLILDKKVDGRTEINLTPKSGSVYIHGTVAYAETVRMDVFEKPLVFKIGISQGSKVRESYYFMAKTLQVGTIYLINSFIFAKYKAFYFKGKSILD